MEEPLTTMTLIMTMMATTAIMAMVRTLFASAGSAVVVCNLVNDL